MGSEMCIRDRLRTLGPAPTVFVMNPNYLDEIRAQCVAMGVDAQFVSV